MATFSSVTTSHVRQALAEHDSRGAEAFLALYGFEPSGATLTHEGRGYDARAILAVAHRYATGRLAQPEEFHGVTQAVQLLRRRGFDVAEPPGARRTPATPATRASARTGTSRPAAPARRAPAREERIALCPTCSMTLPATGVCDYCS